jgi:hypothetical protein
MENVEEVKGEIVIKKDGWKITPDSLKKNNEKQLAKDIKFIKKVNPASGLTFQRHIKGAVGCETHIDNPDSHAKCIMAMKKANLL